MSRVAGRAGVRRMIKRLPDAVSAEIVDEFERAGREIVPVMRSRAPVRTGATQAGISYKVLARSLKLLIGLISTPKGRAKLFYSRIQDLGRKAQVVTVTRFHKGATRTVFRGRKFGQTSTYSMNVRAMPGKRFVTGSYGPFRNRITANLKGIWGRALGRAAAGAGSDT